MIMKYDYEMKYDHEIRARNMIMKCGIVDDHGVSKK